MQACAALVPELVSGMVASGQELAADADPEWEQVQLAKDLAPDSDLVEVVSALAVAAPDLGPESVREGLALFVALSLNYMV